jgi:hypothetical protein
MILFGMLETTVEDQAVHVGGSMARLVHVAPPQDGLVLRKFADLKRIVLKREGDGVVEYGRKAKKVYGKTGGNTRIVI